MIGDGPLHGRNERLLEPGPDDRKHLADQVVLGGEAVHHDAVADTESPRQHAEGEPAESLLEHSGDCSPEHLLLGVPITHHAWL